MRILPPSSTVVKLYMHRWQLKTRRICRREPFAPSQTLRNALFYRSFNCSPDQRRQCCDRSHYGTRKIGRICKVDSWPGR